MGWQNSLRWAPQTRWDPASRSPVTPHASVTMDKTHPLPKLRRTGGSGEEPHPRTDMPDAGPAAPGDKPCGARPCFLLSLPRLQEAPASLSHLLRALVPGAAQPRPADTAPQTALPRTHVAHDVGTPFRSASTVCAGCIPSGVKTNLHGLYPMIRQTAKVSNTTWAKGSGPQGQHARRDRVRSKCACAS